MDDMLKSVLLAGLIIGVLSGIPIINIGCCLWVIGGGILAVFLLNKFSGKKADKGKGAMVGLISGLVGAAIASTLGAIFSILFKTALLSFLSTMGQPVEALQGGVTAVGLIISLIFNLVIFGLFGLLGGILGAVILEKK